AAPTALTADAAALPTVIFHATGTAGNVDHLILTPATATITADDSQTYAVEGRDQYDNSLGDVTSSTSLSMDATPCTGAVCATTAIGAHTVTGTFLGATG